MIVRAWRLLTEHRPEPRNTGNVIAWWEIRRPLYTAVVFAGVCLDVILWALTIKEWVSMIVPPFFFLMAVIMFLVAANVCYTGGWIVELIVRNAANHTRPLVTRFAKRAFLTGTIFSFFLTASPGFISLCSYVAGSPLTTPQSTYTTVKPAQADLVGRYVATAGSVDRLQRAGLDPDQPHYVDLRPDGTCKLVNYPRGLETGMGETPGVVSVSGAWGLAEDTWSYRHTWHITAKDTATRPSRRPSASRPFSESFQLRNDAPPYELFEWIGDPDSWDYLVFRQQLPGDTTTSRPLDRSR